MRMNEISEDDDFYKRFDDEKQRGSVRNESDAFYKL